MAQKDTLDQIIHSLPAAGDPKATIRVVTIRLPQGLHEALTDEAHERKVSLNKLAIAKLRVKGAVLDRVIAEE